MGLRIRADELGSARRDLELLAVQQPGPVVSMALGLIAFLDADFPTSREHLESAFLGFRAEGRTRRAAIAASHLGRLAASGLGNDLVAAGWHARALRLLGDDDCVERGWVALTLLGCSVASADDLSRDSALALDLATRFTDVDLECRALADSGLALVSAGRQADGLARLDEALTMCLSGECDNVWVVGQVQCSFVSACERLGDLPRLQDWMSATQDRGRAGSGPPAVLVTHCQIAFGSLLCQAGRWSQADEELRASVRRSQDRHADQTAEARASLAELRIHQGRCAEAADLLDGLHDAKQAQAALCLLHHVRGDHDLAVATGRSAVRELSGDALRGARLLALLVASELARGCVPAARELAGELTRTARATTCRPVRAHAALASARVALAEGSLRDALSLLADALRVLGDGWPLQAAECRLALGQALAATDPAAAANEARLALAVLGPIGSRHRAEAQDLLHRLGRPEDPPAGPLTVLTAREREVLGLLGAGLSNPEIARRLVISPKTAEHHVGAIMKKLQVRSRSEAAVLAVTGLSPRASATQ